VSPKTIRDLHVFFLKKKKKKKKKTHVFHLHVKGDMSFLEKIFCSFFFINLGVNILMVTKLNNKI
jgi:hypothetical protein